MTSPSAIAINASNLGKRYWLSTERRPDTLREAISGTATNLLSNLRFGKSERRAQAGEHWALRDVSFELPRGAALGIIGRNGSGKSTLLKILSRITAPTTGSAEVYGRVGALLEIGTGFHPDMTGRENALFNGMIIGMSRQEVFEKFDRIVEFAGIGDYIDTPIKYYSSGMVTRLAFAVAAHLDPDILIVDEVLAVGDIEFQRKSMAKMRELFEEEGRTVIVVSHAMDSIRQLCSHAIWLDRGQCMAFGSADRVADAYLSTVAIKESDSGLIHKPEREGEGPIRFTKLRLRDERNLPKFEFRTGDTLQCMIDFSASADLAQSKVTVRLRVLDETGRILAMQSSATSDLPLRVSGMVGSISCLLPNLPFLAGHYSIQLEVEVAGRLSDRIRHAATLIVIGSGVHEMAPIEREGYFILPGRWSVVAD